MKRKLNEGNKMSRAVVKSRESIAASVEPAVEPSTPFKPQVHMPKEEDLNNWSHHFGAQTTTDEYVRFLHEYAT